MPPFRTFLEPLSCQVMLALLRFSPGYAMVQEKVVLILALTQLSVAGKHKMHSLCKENQAKMLLLCLEGMFLPFSFPTENLQNILMLQKEQNMR